MPTPPITQSEIVFRQIGMAGTPIVYDPARFPPIHHTLFYPTKADTDGLSLIRSRFRSEIWAAHRIEKNDKQFRLAHINIDHLTQIALSVGFDDFRFRSTADSLDALHGEPYAHCVAEQINRIDYENDEVAKTRIIDWAKKISETISHDVITGPHPLPSLNDPYRPDDFVE